MTTPDEHPEASGDLPSRLGAFEILALIGEGGNGRIYRARALADGNGWDWEKTNVNGGAIALGHPVGQSGARIVTTLLHEMKRRNLRYGAATLCVGGGQGAALILERV